MKRYTFPSSVFFHFTMFGGFELKYFQNDVIGEIVLETLELDSIKPNLNGYYIKFSNYLLDLEIYDN